MHECKSHEEWLTSIHYMCSCGHVEWAHYGSDRFNKGRCAHCNCTCYNGETRPLTNYEIQKQATLQCALEDAGVTEADVEKCLEKK